MMQFLQKLFTLQRLLVPWHLFRQTILPYAPRCLYECVPFELGNEPFDEIQVGFRRSDFELYVFEHEGKVVFGAVF
jgi:hypothetical protein